MEICSENFFSDYGKDLWLTEGLYKSFFMLVENFDISYQNMMPDT